MASAEYPEGSLSSADGTALHYRWRAQPAPRAIVVLLHGLAEHTDRSEHVVDGLLDRGFSCLAFDLRGHGQSSGRRHHVPRFEAYLDDLDAVLAHVASLAPASVPRFLVGHSLGGLIVAAHVTARRTALAGVVLVSPALEFALRPGPLRRFAAACLDVIAPWFPMASHMPLDRVSRNPDVEAQMRAENPGGVDVTPRWYLSCRRAQERLVGGTGPWSVPVLTLTAGRDAIVDTEAARRFHLAAGGLPEDSVCFEACFHALFDEPERDAVLARLATWLERQLPSQGA